MLQRFFDPARELGQALTRVRPALRRAAAFSLVLNVLYLVPSLYMLQVYDRVITSRNLTTLLMLTLMLGAAYVVFGIMDRVRSQMLVRVGLKLDQLMAQRVFTAASERLLRTGSGHPSQALSDLTQVRQFVGGTGALAFFDIPWLPVYLIVLGILHPFFLLFAVVVMLVLFGVTWLNEWRTHKPITEANKEAAANQAFLNGNLRNMEAITALGMAGALRRRWSERQAKVLAWQTVSSEEASLLGAWSKTLRLLFQSLVLGLGAWLVVDNQMTPGGMIGGSILLGRALAPVDQLLQAWKQWVTAKDAWDRLEDLLKTYPAAPERLQLPDPQGAVALEDVHATAPAGKRPILQGVGFRIEPGDVVLVGGHSGCGKTTLARLILGVWPPARGTVRLDGADVYTWDKEHLGAHVGYLPQEVALLQGTVAENISRFGKLDSEAVVRAAQAAGVHEMVLRLPEGYDTVLGPEGAGLSGGQKQRVALARALYGDPKLLVLDEPNSNLDQQGEQALMQAVRQAKGRGCTVIVIAHGQNLLQVADKMLILNDGKLAVYGPRDKVLAHLAGPGAKLAVPAAVGATA